MNTATHTIRFGGLIPSYYQAAPESKGVNYILTCDIDEATGMPLAEAVELAKALQKLYTCGVRAYPLTKIYSVGIDESGIMVATLDIHDIKGLTEVHDIEAQDSFRAKLAYAAFMNSEGQASTYFESL